MRLTVTVTIVTTQGTQGRETCALHLFTVDSVQFLMKTSLGAYLSRNTIRLNKNKYKTLPIYNQSVISNYTSDHVTRTHEYYRII